MNVHKISPPFGGRNEGIQLGFRTSAKLTALKVKNLSAPGRYGDGGGLYLQISRFETKAWIYRFMLNGRGREMGLGPYPEVELASAREKALECRRLVAEGKDPIEVRNATRQNVAMAQAKAVTFDYCAKAYIESHRRGWKNEKHAAQWESTLRMYASPIFGNLPVHVIDTALVMRALEPVWTRVPETASRLRNRVELVLAWASARGYRTIENPARWRGHLDKLLPKQSSVRRVVHHPAMPFDDLPDFLEKVRIHNEQTYRALEFLILSACRTSEVLGARWGEINLEQGVWTIPGARMKAKREHRVPLTPRMLEILELQRPLARGPLVFPGRGEGKQLSNMALLVILRRMGLKLTVHGFRSSFRDWCAERTNFPREVAEAALAHVVRDAVEAAYRRGDLFEKRRHLMEAWAAFCNSKQRNHQVVGEVSDLARHRGTKKGLGLAKERESREANRRPLSERILSCPAGD